MNGDTEREEAGKSVQDALAEMQGRLYALVFTLMAGSEDVRDVLQDVNLAILKNAAAYDPRYPFWPWFKRFAINEVNHYRERQKVSPVVFDSELADKIAERFPDESADEAPGEVDYAKLLAECLKKVPAWQRDLLFRRYSGVESVSAMARSLRLTADSLSVLFFRLRKSLRRCMEKLSKKDAAEEGEKEFARTLDRLTDGEATTAEKAALALRLADSSERLDEYVQQMQMHALLHCRYRLIFAEKAGGEEPRDAKPVFRVYARAAAVAAALAALATLAAVFGARKGKGLDRASQAVETVAAREEGIAEKAAEVPIVAAPQAEEEDGKEEPRVMLAAEKASQEADPVNVQRETPVLPAVGREEEMMNAFAQTAAVTATSLAIASIAADAVASQTGSVGNVSDEVMIVVAPEKTPLWRTVLERQTTLRWAWPGNATAATLTVKGMASTFSKTFEKPAAEGSVTFPAPSQESGTEDLYAITLAFDNGEKLTAQLANVEGMQSPSRCLNVTSRTARPWNKTYKYAVLPVDYGMTSFTLNGTAVADLDGAAGWYGWTTSKMGKYSLELAGNGTTQSAELERVQSGTVVILR